MTEPAPALTWTATVLILDDGEGRAAFRAGMKLVVVGGQSRDIGKTLVVSGIIRGLKSLDWTAVKITPHAPGFDSAGIDAAGAGPAERNFVLAEEKSPLARGDTGRFLASGARRSLWLRVQPGRLSEAIPILKDALAADPFVIIESNRILSFLEPAVSVFVLGNEERELKFSARRFLTRADALVAVEPGFDGPSIRGIDLRLLKDKPTFLFSRRSRINLELCRWIRRKLESAGDDPMAGIRTPCRELKEQPWLR